VLALPRWEEMRLYGLLAGGTERVCGLQRERASMALDSVREILGFNKAGRVVGWSDPTFFSLAPKKVFGVVPAHTRPRKVSMMQLFTISIP